MSGTSGSSSHQMRTRSERVAAVVNSRGLFTKVFAFIHDDLRFPLIAIMLLFCFAVCIVIEAWKPPFPFRLNDVPRRPIVCQTPFKVVNNDETNEARYRAKITTAPVYTLDSAQLIQVRDTLINTVTGLLRTANFDEVADPKIWTDFVYQANHDATVDPNLEAKTLFNALKQSYGDEQRIQTFQNSLKAALEPIETTGFMFEIPPHVKNEFRNQERITVVAPDGVEKLTYENNVLFGDGTRLRQLLEMEFKPGIISDSFFRWLAPRMKTIGNTLKFDDPKTVAAMDKAVHAVETVFNSYPRDRVIAPSDRPITPETLQLLVMEYNIQLLQLTMDQKIVRFACVYFLMVVGHFIGWVYLFRRERRKPKTLFSSTLLVVFFLLTVITAKLLSYVTVVQGYLILIPLLLFAESLAITFSWELSMVVSLNLVLALVLADGPRFGSIVILAGTMIAVIEQLGRLRSRSKLVVVGFLSGIVCFCITITVGILEGHPISTPLWTEAILNGVWTLMAGVVMTGLLPFIERPFGILTDMSLLELGDVTHPLLQEMIRRAPATYSHSIQVGAIAEAASDAIGARGLMTRVGAYFHDIGKILKPQFFTENQSGENIHDSLDPRISALVIVAHVKDGADLARQHRLPRPLIDLIEQHHGTSLVSYFHGLATRQNKDNPYGQTVDENSFRYPGPKPKSKEAAILMLADAAESAVRSMGDAANPGRIENMVRQISEAKLKDGQFDDCGLTLHELRTVEKSIITSLIAVRHNRIKYPGQEKVEGGNTAAISPKPSSAVTITLDSTVADGTNIVKKQ